MIKYKLQRDSQVTPHKNTTQSCKYERLLFSASYVVTPGRMLPAESSFIYNGPRKADGQCRVIVCSGNTGTFTLLTTAECRLQIQHVLCC
jgi:hypothetical protein